MQSGLLLNHEYESWVGPKNLAGFSPPLAIETASDNNQHKMSTMQICVIKLLIVKPGARKFRNQVQNFSSLGLPWFYKAPAFM
jgi:hypothetical protein